MFKMIHCVGPLVFHGGKIPNSHLATRFPTRSSTVCMWSVWMVLLASLMSMSLGSLGWHVEAGWKCPGAMEILICRFCRFPRSKWLYRFRSAESTIYVYKCMYIYISVPREAICFPFYVYLLEGMLILVQCEFSEVAVTPGLSQHHGAYGTEHLAAVTRGSCLVWGWWIRFLPGFTWTSNPLDV